MTLVGAGSDETVKVDTTGTATYEFENLPAGSYIIEVVAFAGTEETELVKSTEVVITAKDAENMTGIAGFVRKGTAGVAGVEVELGNKKTTTDYDGYFELELAAGIHDITFTSGAGVHIEEDVVVVEGRTTGLVVLEGTLGIPSIDKNTITAAVVGPNGKAVTVGKMILQAKVDGEWMDIIEKTPSAGTEVFDENDVAGTGFPHDVVYRFEASGTNVVGKVYSNEVNFKPNPAKNIDLLVNLKEVDVKTVEDMNLTVNLKDNKGNDATVAPGTLSLHTFDGVKWDEAGTSATSGDLTTKFEDLKLLTGEEVMLKYTPSSVGATSATKAEATEQGMTVIAKEAGAAGTGIKVVIVNGEDNNDTLTVSVSDKVITVTAEDDGAFITSTITEIVAAINADTEANELVVASGTGATATAADITLAGGADATTADAFAVTTQKVKIAKEGKDQTLSMRLASSELANKATVNFKTADKKEFNNDDYDLRVYDNNDFPIVATTEGTLSLDTDKSKSTYETTYMLPYGNYTVEIANNDDTGKGSMVIGGKQEYKLQISKTAAVIKEALVNLGVEVNLDGAAAAVYDSEEATPTGRVIYADVVNKDGKVVETERFVYSNDDDEDVILAGGKDYTVVTKGFRLTDQELDTKFEVKRKADGTIEEPSPASVTLPETLNVEDGAVVSGKVTRNGVLVDGATVTAYLGGRRLASENTTDGVYEDLKLPHAGEYTLVVRGNKIATSEFKLNAKAGATIKDLELKVTSLEDGEFTIISNDEISEIEVLDSYTAKLGERGFDAAEGVITDGDANVTLAGKTVKVVDLTQGEYLVRVTPESKNLDPILTTINIGRKGAKVTRRIDFPSALNKRTVEVNFLDSKDGKAKDVTGTLIAINANGDIIAIEKVATDDTQTLELQDGNYTLKFVQDGAADVQDIYVGVEGVEVDGVSVSVDMSIVAK